MSELPLTANCQWPGCTKPALCASGNVAGALVCSEHFDITNGAPEDATEQDIENMKQMILVAKGAVPCLRCGRLCRPGTPDPKARAIRHAAAGFCPNCMITKFLLSIEAIKEMIDGTPSRVGPATQTGVKYRPARPGLGPEILFVPDGQPVRDQIAVILKHTQMRADEIDYIEVVGNWGLPWPKGREPQPGANY